MDQWILTLLTFVPLLGAAVILLMPGQEGEPDPLDLCGHNGGLCATGDLAVYVVRSS